MPLRDPAHGLAISVPVQRQRQQLAHLRDRKPEIAAAPPQDKPLDIGGGVKPLLCGAAVGWGLSAKVAAVTALVMGGSYLVMKPHRSKQSAASCGCGGADCRPDSSCALPRNP